MTKIANNNEYVNRQRSLRRLYRFFIPLRVKYVIMKRYA